MFHTRPYETISHIITTLEKNVLKLRVQVVLVKNFMEHFSRLILFSVTEKIAVGAARVVDAASMPYGRSLHRLVPRYRPHKTDPNCGVAQGEYCQSSNQQFTPGSKRL